MHKFKTLNKILIVLLIAVFLCVFFVACNPVNPINPEDDPSLTPPSDSDYIDGTTNFNKLVEALSYEQSDTFSFEIFLVWDKYNKRTENGKEVILNRNHTLIRLAANIGVRNEENEVLVEFFSGEELSSYTIIGLLLFQ